MKITIEVDDTDVANEVAESLRHEAESIGIVHPGTANMLRGVADQIENQIEDQIEDAIPETVEGRVDIPDGEKTQVFNVANLKEQMQENVLAVLDGLLDYIGPAVKNAVEGQVCQVILDTIDPPEIYIDTYTPSHTDPAGIEFYVQRTDLHEWSVFQKYTDIHGSTWETSPCDTVDDCDTEAEAVQASKELIQGRIDAES